MTVDQKLDRILELLERREDGLFTDWDDVPLVLDVKGAARVLNSSPETLYRRLSQGKHVPGQMPRDGQGRHRFSKAALKIYLEGGYARFGTRGRR